MDVVVEIANVIPEDVDIDLGEADVVLGEVV